MLVYFVLLQYLAWAAAQINFTNPIIWQDLPDIDLIRHGDAYYYSASTFQFSPGAVILRSYDLVNWKYLSHSVPSLEFGNTEGFDLSTDTFYWGGCIVGDWKTYIYTAPAVEGPWTQSSVIGICLYDAGMLIDEDDTMYVAHDNTSISVAQLSDDGLRVDDDGWPHVDFVDGQWSSSYPYPLPEHPVKPITGTDKFETLGPQYQWNHNPDNSAWAINNGLELHTATVTDDFFRAGNTLTHRILGPQSTLTVELDHSRMADGDRAGVVLFRYAAAWIGIIKSGNSTRVAMVNNILMIPDDGWHTVNKGDEIASVEVSGGIVWLRLEVGVNSFYNQEGRFSYSTDGVNFEPLGEPHEEIDRGILHFMGYRYGVFNYATLARGGAVTVKSLSIHE
ncbi:glycosyl hydrolase family 43 [Colletotrichum melonis]|uniref:Glycosyl hydrolase family 43 n=1 Tax=Colletotrichum melonis TaxID=1209925 RepID=A0AAI9UWS6_9PEZI|nr:glycosyl hydrolase family 43 [Colletotrichum melonis]